MSFNSKYKNITRSNPIDEFMCLNGSKDTKPFGIHWLNNAHMETVLPGSFWEQVYDSIIPDLCNKLITQFSHENRKQALFELLGKHFVSKYFPQDDPDPSVTRPPMISTEESIKLYDEAKKWLNITVERIIKEKGVYDRDTGIVSDEMLSYVDQARNIFMSHFQKELSKRETEYFKSISTSKPNFRPSNAELHHKPVTAVSSVYDSDLPYTVQEISPYGPEMMIAPLPHCISFQSEFIGESLAALCHNNEKEIQKISKTMSGRRLPISLRKCIWKNVLLASQSPIYDKEINFEELLREKFSRTVTRGITELMISKEMKSPVNELLENLIIEHYEKSRPLNKFCGDVEYLSEAVKILNILYTYDRSYDPHLVFWLFPLHFGLKENADSLPMNRIPFSYDVAMYLSLMHHVYPTWSDIFNMSENVLHRLSLSDSQIATHISNVAKKNVLSKPKDFLAQIMNVERNEAKKTRLTLVVNEDSENDIRGFEILKSPIIFIRKWIGEGFVSVLNSESVLFLFDQLFMEQFSALVFEDACLSVILLLKDRFLVTDDHGSMKTVFLEYPSSLFTVDIIRAWTWIHRGGDLASVPAMNRREMYRHIPPTVTPVQPSTRSAILLPLISLNDVRLKLIFRASNDNETKFVTDINPDMIFVRTSLFLCNSRLVELGTRSVPQLRSSVKEDSVMTNSYRYSLDEIIEFDNIDVTHLAKDFKEGNKLSVVVSVIYRGANGSDTTMGWCLLPCIVEEDDNVIKMTASQLMRPAEFLLENSLKTYVLKLSVKRLRHEIPLLSGDIPIDLIPISDTFKFAPILEGSMLSIYSFDSSRGAPSPPPETPRILEPVKSPTPPPPRSPPPPEPFTPDPETIIPPKETPTEPRVDSDAWVPFNADAFQKVKPRLSSKMEPFCLYIDQIRFLPDTATIIKVTGRFFQTGLDEQIPDILIIPDVETDPRSPKVRASSRVVVNKENTMNLNKNSILILRVYTVLKTNLAITVIGNVIVPIFDQEEKLLSGYFQKRLRNQMPNIGLVNSNEINKNSLDRALYIDCVSITYRLWPYTENNIVAPEYSSGLYESSDCKPTRFEWDIFALYKSDTFLSKDLREVVKDIKYRDANPDFKDAAVSHAFMLNYIPYRLDITKFSPVDQAPKHVDTVLMFHYRIEKGINIKISNVYGLKEDRLLFVTTKVLRGDRTLETPARPSLGYGIDDFQVFSMLDPNSEMRAPKWKDSFTLVKPYFDEKALLVVQVWGINATIKSGVFCDKVTNKPITKLVRENLVGWTAVSLFKHGFVNTGKHQLPLLKNRIHNALLKRFQNISITAVLQNEEEFKTLEPCSMVLYLFDAHKGIDEYPANQPMLTEIIDNLATEKDAFLKAMETEVRTKTVLQEVDEIVSAAELSGRSRESKSSLFQKLFTELAKTLSVSVPAKQPHLPIFFY